MFFADSAANESDDDPVMSVDVGLRYSFDAILLGARVYVPFNEDLRDLGMLGIGVDVGVRP